LKTGEGMLCMPASVPGIGGQHGWYVGNDPNPNTVWDEYCGYNLRSGRYLEIWRDSSGPMDANSIQYNGTAAEEGPAAS